jgi:hypothetical protein
MTVVGRYSKYRRWAMALAVELGYETDEDRIVALVALFDASREYVPKMGAPMFRDYARSLIEARLEEHARA